MYKIKRPLAVAGFTFFITGSTILSMPKEYTAVLLALFALFTFIHSKTAKVYTKHLVLMLVTAVVAVVYINIYGILWHNNISKISTDDAVYNGYISAVNNADNTSYTVTVLNNRGREDYKVTLYYGNSFAIGDTITVTGKFKPVKYNKYVFSNYADNILGTISVSEMTEGDFTVSTIKYKALAIRRTLLEKTKELYQGDVAAVASAVAYNDKHLVSQQIKDSFIAAGMSHALVVSGLHVGIIAAVILKLFSFVPIDKKLKNVIAAVFIVAFMYIIGFSASVVRAGVLTAVILLSANFRKQQDSVTSLALIGLVCILANPYITRHIGAMLSYAASVGMVVANIWCSRRKIDGNKRNLVCASAAVIFTLPIAALAGMDITIFSPLYNLLLAGFVAVICVLSVATPVASFIPFVKFLVTPFVFINSLLVNILLAVLDFIKNKFAFALVNLAHPIFLTVIFAAIVAYFVARLQFRNGRTRKIFVTAVSIAVFICYNLLNWNTVTVTAFDSGRECSFHITSRGREYLVLSEEITQNKAVQRLVSVNGRRYDGIYYCPKEADIYYDLSDVTDNFVTADGNKKYETPYFTLHSNWDKNAKLFTISVAECDISFGQGKITSCDSDYYFLGNDKPKEVIAEEIYIFGNIPKWMDVENISAVNSDITIKINLKTGRYKTVEDVFNFGW